MLNAMILNSNVVRARGIRRLYSQALLDPRQTLAWTAQVLASSCGSDAITRLLADERPHREPVHSLFGFPLTKGLACIANIRGCLFIALIAPVYKRYDADTLDFAAHLRLASTLLWLREHSSEGSIEERFERRPAELRSPNHASGFDAERGALYVQNLYQTPARGKQFELPIADAR
jgi:hypothetical protein